MENSERTVVDCGAAEAAGGSKRRMRKAPILGWLVWFALVVLLAYLVNLLNHGG
jgi:hypothetical protein